MLKKFFTDDFGDIKAVKSLTEEQELIKLIDAVLSEIDENNKCFKNVTNEDLLDYCMYENKALLAKYTYLLKEARKMGIDEKSMANFA